MPPRLRTLRGFITAGLALLLAGCGPWKTAKAPMDSVLEKSACTAHADTLLVMLPGAYADPDEFVRKGFQAAMAERRLAVDVLRVDAHLGYYDNQGSIFLRLHDDVIAPARRHGYRSIWVLGISVGGLGALAYAQRHPGELTGIVALAPYLGERLTSTEIANAGGLARWRAPVGALAPEQRDLQLWRWLQGYDSPQGAAERPPLYLGWGLDDRFAFSDRLLASVLPPERVFATEGGHDWPPWRRLWSRILPTLPLPACAKLSRAPGG